MSEALEKLCRLCGVLDEYRDIWGRAHAPSDAARRVLLAAMGIAADSDEAIARALDDFDRREWARPLPPVLVLREADRPHRIVISLPEDAALRTLRWRLAMESGAEEGGEFSPSDLEEAGRRELDGRIHVRRVLALDLALEPGYHGFSLAAGAEALGAMSLIVVPATCYQPQALNEDGRVWGFAAQLYGVRSERNWGMGDFGDLRRILEHCGEAGAGTLLLNPLHALFPDAPEHASPYSPSHRAFFNPLYLEIPAMADFSECTEARAMVFAPAFQARLRALRGAAQVDYPGVAELKAKVLALLHAHFRDHQLARDGERARAFRAFQAEQGGNLRGQALFEALQEHFRAGDAGVWGWPAWPESYRVSEAPEVAAFMEAHRERVEFFEYLQWQVAVQLAAVGTRSWELGLGVGIMLDLAIGVAEGGAATWMRRDLYALGASTGAPPDEINRMGQDWGLPPLIPWRLTEAAYAPFIEVLRANMRDAGALRIDHVMGLFRLFWVARGLPAAEGAYVAYPSADLLGILALES
jgi:(1->4)-alpha-D-glucan 1-alpha-D-glucosylmutase